jgi:hypothetical protein
MTEERKTLLREVLRSNTKSQLPVRGNSVKIKRDNVKT